MMIASNLEIQHQNHIIGVNSCQKQKISHNIIKTHSFIYRKMRRMPKVKGVVGQEKKKKKTELNHGL